MRISVTKKITGMVVMIVLAICLVVGIGSANIIKGNITDEIEIQLKTGAYAISQTLEYCSSDSEMNENIYDLYDYSNIDITVFNSEAIRVASTVNGAVGTSMDSHILEELQTGKDYFATNANVNGQPYFGYYIPFFVDEEFNGATFTGIPQSEAIQTIMFSIMKIIGLIVICGVVAIIVATLLVRGIVKGINKLREMIQLLADNDLSVEFDKYEFEHDEVESAYNDLVDVMRHLRNIMMNSSNLAKELKSISSDLNTNVQLTNDTCDQISQAVENVASGAVSQAEDTTNAAQNIGEMSEELGKIKTNANGLHSIANSMDNAKNDAINTLVEFQKVNGIIVEEINSISNQVDATSESVKLIEKAVKMIQDIADQTKLLSLNASIEAAHAGEHGKGFAVVASEIGKLASQSTQSSVEIEEILKQLVKNYNVIIQNVKSTSDNMNIQNGKLIDTQNVFNVLEKDINGTVERIAEINTMVEYLDVEINKMVDMISNLSAISQENSASTEETMAAIEELTATMNQMSEKSQNVDKGADELEKETDVFKTV